MTVLRFFLQNSFALPLDESNSDHRPIEFNIQNNQGSRRNSKFKAFKFEECWTKHAKCHDIIQTNGLWSSSSVTSTPLNQNLENCA